MIADLDHETFANNVRDGYGYPNRQDDIIHVLLDYSARYRDTKSILNSQQMNNVFQKCYMSIVENMEKILERSKAGATPKTVEAIIPLAQEINITIKFIEDMSSLFEIGRRSEKKIEEE